MKGEYINNGAPSEPNGLEVHVDYDAWLKMKEYVRQNPKEIGWMGLVKRTNNVFHIYEVFLVEQLVASATTDMTPAGFFALDARFEREGREAELNANMRFWGHSHANLGGVTPSGRDIETLMSYWTESTQFFVVAIFEKNGTYRFDVAFFNEGIKWTSIPVTVLNDPYSDLRKGVAQEILDYVQDKPIPAVTHGVPAVQMPLKSTGAFLPPPRQLTRKERKAAKRAQQKILGGQFVKVGGTCYYQNPKGAWVDGDDGAEIISPKEIDDMLCNSGMTNSELNAFIIEGIKNGDLIPT